jgi:hypothetical protein
LAPRLCAASTLREEYPAARLVRFDDPDSCETEIQIMITRWRTPATFTVSTLGPLLLGLTVVACQSPNGGSPPLTGNPASTEAHGGQIAHAPEAKSVHAHEAGPGGTSEVEEAALPDHMRTQSAEYIRSYFTIKLTPDQERIKQEALEGIPAPCCSNYSIATCCCPCNLAKAAWGLSHQLIAQSGYGVVQVRQAVTEWLESTNPEGYRGDACYTPGGCTRPFNQDGCGGMGGEIITG